MGCQEGARASLRPTLPDGLAPAHVQASGALYGVLNALCEGDAYETLLNVPKGNGLEAWRRYARDNVPRGLGTTRTRLMWLVQPRGLTGPWKSQVNVWERYEREYVALGSSPLAEDLRMGVLQNFLSPEEVTQLSLAVQKLLRWSRVEEELADSLGRAPSHVELAGGEHTPRSAPHHSSLTMAARPARAARPPPQSPAQPRLPMRGRLAFRWRRAPRQTGRS